MAERPTIYAIGDEALMSLADRMGSGGTGSGSGSGSGGIEARIAKVEAVIEHIKTDLSDVKSDVRNLRSDANRDFRIIFGAIIALALGLAGLMAKGFHWL